MRVDYKCETCGQGGVRYYAKHRVPAHFFCSVACQNEWQKTREDIVAKNKDPAFRKKVSAGLRRRKLDLGDDYHSRATKEKIGASTKARWKRVSHKILPVLLENARNLKTRHDYPYDFEWNKLSRRLRQDHVCSRCLSRKGLVLHHIVPASEGGSNSLENILVLCSHCHPIVERQQRVVFDLVGDWEVVALLIKSRLWRMRIRGTKKCSY